MNYLYESSDGEIVEIMMTVAEMEKKQRPDRTIKLPDGRVGKRRKDLELMPSNAGKGWPMACEALAVHPQQIAEAMEHDRSHGVPTRYTPDGSPIFESRGHKRAYCKVQGVHDRDGYSRA